MYSQGRMDLFMDRMIGDDTCVQSQVVGSVFVDFKAPQDGGGLMT